MGQKMPTRYVIEMFIDRIAASKTYQGEEYKDTHPLEYYEQGAAKLGRMIHPDTAKQLHFLLAMLAEKGKKKPLLISVIRFLKKKKIVLTFSKSYSNIIFGRSIERHLQRRCRNWQTSKTKDLVSIVLVWVQVPSSAVR